MATRLLDGESAVVQVPPGAEDFLGMLEFTTRDVHGVLVVAFEATDDGAIDWQSTQRDWLYKLIESHPDTRFAIDLSEVNYLASSEIGFLVTLKRRIDRRQGRVVMFGAGDYIAGPLSDHEPGENLRHERKGRSPWRDQAGRPPGRPETRTSRSGEGGWRVVGGERWLPEDGPRNDPPAPACPLYSIAWMTSWPGSRIAKADTDGSTARSSSRMPRKDASEQGASIRAG